MNKILYPIKNIFLVMSSIIIIILLFPFYFIYIFAKTLSDIDEMGYFYENIFNLIFGMRDLSDVKINMSYLNKRNKRLENFIEQIKCKIDNSDIAIDDKYNEIVGIINDIEK